MISSRCSGGAKEKIFWNATVFRGMDSTMTPSKSRMRVVKGVLGILLSLFIVSILIRYCEPSVWLFPRDPDIYCGKPNRAQPHLDPLD